MRSAVSGSFSSWQGRCMFRTCCAVVVATVCYSGLLLTLGAAPRQHDPQSQRPGNVGGAAARVPRGANEVAAAVARWWVPELPLTVFDDQFALSAVLDDDGPSTTTGSVPGRRASPAALARCAIWLLDHPVCQDPYVRRRRSARECLLAFPMERWLLFAPPSCPLAAFAAAVGVPPTSRAQASTSAASDVFLGDAMLVATRPLASRRQAYVAPQQRVFGDARLLRGRHRCTTGGAGGSALFDVFPSGYFIPACNVRGDVNSGATAADLFLWDWSVVLPSVSPTSLTASTSGHMYPRNEFLFAPEDELWYTLSLRYSRFAWTVRRTGVNAQRTMEILAAGGGLPLYPSAERCHESNGTHGDTNCLLQLPMDVIREIRELDGVRHIAGAGALSPVEESPAVIRKLLRRMDAEAYSSDGAAVPLDAADADGHGTPCSCPSVVGSTSPTLRAPAESGQSGKEGCMCFSRFLFLRQGRINVKQVGTVSWGNASDRSNGTLGGSGFSPAMHRSLRATLSRFAAARLTHGAGMASMLRRAGCEEPRRVLHLVHCEDVTTGNNGVGGLAELGITYARNVEHGIEHWSQEEEDEESVEQCTGSAIFHNGSSNDSSVVRLRNSWTMAAYMRWKHSARVRGAYAHGYFYAHRYPPPPLPHVEMSAATSDERCVQVLQEGGFDVIMFGGVMPSASRIPCYAAIVQLLRASRDAGAANRTSLLVIDESDSPIGDDGRYERLVGDGAHVFALNPPRGCS